jgi:hypothetical protein
MQARTSSDTDQTRRDWLRGAALLGLGLTAADAPPRDAGPPNRPDPVESIRLRARKAGLKAFRSVETPHYAGAGDADEGFLIEALKVCESLAASFQNYFEGKGFDVRWPGRRMVVAVLGGRASYEAFKGKPAAPNEGGHYDVGDDLLVVYDFRNGAERDGVDPTRLNTFTLVHEALHQLTFDTGMLSRAADVPVAVSEGLATLGESWMLRSPNLGKVNRHRLAEIRSPWIPVDELLTRDGLFDDPETEGPAYAESWLLMYEQLKTREKAAKLRGYLAAIRERRDPAKRLDDARRTLGDLGRLDAALKKSARLLLS